MCFCEHIMKLAEGNLHFEGRDVSGFHGGEDSRRGILVGRGHDCASVDTLIV
jgi:hypothetical protein